MKKLLLTVLVGAIISLGFVCYADHPTSDHPTSDHPTSDHPTSDHPTLGYSVEEDEEAVLDEPSGEVSEDPTLEQLDADEDDLDLEQPVADYPTPEHPR